MYVYEIKSTKSAVKITQYLGKALKLILRWSMAAKSYLYCKTKPEKNFPFHYFGSLRFPFD
jgi:hypothetical protein